MVFFKDTLGLVSPGVTTDDFSYFADKTKSSTNFTLTFDQLTPLRKTKRQKRNSVCLLLKQFNHEVTALYSSQYIESKLLKTPDGPKIRSSYRGCSHNTPCLFVIKRKEKKIDKQIKHQNCVKLKFATDLNGYWRIQFTYSTC